MPSSFPRLYVITEATGWIDAHNEAPQARAGGAANGWREEGAALRRGFLSLFETMECNRAHWNATWRWINHGSTVTTHESKFAFTSSCIICHLTLLHLTCRLLPLGLLWSPGIGVQRLITRPSYWYLLPPGEGTHQAKTCVAAHPMWNTHHSSCRS